MENGELIAVAPEAPKPDELLGQYLEAKRSVAEVSESDIDDIESAFRNSPAIREYGLEQITVEKLESSDQLVRDLAVQAGLASELIEDLVARQRELVAEIEKSVEDYVNRVRSFEQVDTIQRLRLDPEHYRESREKHDEYRRYSHNAMIDSFRAYNRFMSVELHTKYGIDVRNEYLFPEEMFPLHTDQRFISRDHSEEWAKQSDYFIRARHLIGRMQEKRRTQEGSVIETV